MKIIMIMLIDNRRPGGGEQEREGHGNYILVVREWAGQREVQRTIVDPTGIWFYFHILQNSLKQF